MLYTPPAGNAVALPLAGAYTPPSGAQVALDLSGITPTPPPPPYTGPGLARWFGVAWQLGDPRGADSLLRWIDAPLKDHSPEIAWQAAEVADHPLACRWSGTGVADAVHGDRWEWGQPLDAARSADWSAVPPRDAARSVAWGWANIRDAAPHLAYGNPPAKDVQRKAAWDWATPHGQRYSTPYGNAPPKDTQHTIPWGWGTPLRQQFFQIPPSVPIVDTTACYQPPPGDRVALPLRQTYLPPPGDQVQLPLRCGDYRIYIIQRTAIMQHTLTVCRLPDRTPLNVASVTIRTDRDSWAWTVDLQIVDRASYHLVLPDGSGPKLIEVAASGYVWTALVERVNERRVAPQDGRATSTRFSASGRSRTAILAAPYAVARPYISTAAMTAQQAAARELEFTSFTLDWQIDDWLIPAGAWRYDNETPMSAILRIAAAAGAIVQSHPQLETIIVKKSYAVVPWSWATATPAVILDGQSLIEMGREWKPGPQYLGVYVSGETQGVLVNVLRAGSAGSPYAQMIVDPLITSTEPARGRGTREIADSENQTLEPIVLPLMPSPAAPGVIFPTELVQVEDPVHGIYKAQATSVSIAASLVNDAVSIRQTVDLARHYPVSLA